MLQPYNNYSQNTTKLIDFTLHQCLDAGIHYGHYKNNWDTRMNNYIFGERRNLHIINLEQTAFLLKRSLNVIIQTIARKGIVLFVSSNDKYSDILYSAATAAKQPCVTKKWVSGTLTNFKKLKPFFFKKHLSNSNFYGNKYFLELNRVPNLIFLDTPQKNEWVLNEALKLNIPVISIVDSNVNPIGISYPIPGNDDSIEAAYLYNKMIYNAILRGYLLNNFYENI